MELYVQCGSGIYYPFNRTYSRAVVGDNLMEIYLQFGHGMMAHAQELLSAWKSGGIILSPRDLTREQLVRTSESTAKLGCETLLDPQCYMRNADHPRLIAHEYFQVLKSTPTGAFQGGAVTASFLGKLAELSRACGVKRAILPGLLANPVSEDWFLFQKNIISEAPNHFGATPILGTIALSHEALLDEVQVESVVERASSWNVSGFYVVGEIPNAYLVDNPVWLSNFLILVSGLKLTGKPVIVGYCNHQMLCLAAAKADVIASGTWLNVRAFQPDKFYAPDEEEVSRRATWYYCPQALSEFKLTFLDMAQRAGVLSEMKPDTLMSSVYAEPLFRGATPSTVNWGEQNAFRHYLSCLRGQIKNATQSSYDATFDKQLSDLDSAEKFLKKLRTAGVLGGDRDFREIFDVNRAALAAYNNARRERMRRAW